jgi:hypothetical protein
LFCGLFGTAFSYTNRLPLNLKVLVFYFPVNSADPERAPTRSCPAFPGFSCFPHVFSYFPTFSSAHCARCAVAHRHSRVYKGMGGTQKVTFGPTSRHGVVWRDLNGGVQAGIKACCGGHRYLPKKICYIMYQSSIRRLPIVTVHRSSVHCFL